MSLSVTVLGCSGSYAGPGGACSGYLVRTAGATVALDLGPGTLANLQDHVALGDLDAVVLSHEHPDHWVELPVLRNALRYYLGVEGLLVCGTPGTRKMAETVTSELEPTLLWQEIDPASVVAVGDLTFSFSRTDHPVDTMAVRADLPDGTSLAYSADTSPEWVGGAEFVAGADMFLCEATISVSDEGDGAPHLSGRQAGQLAQAGGVGRLVLTHQAPGVDPAMQVTDAEGAFDGTVDAAVIGATFRV
jgi:ribonuclease BN (tRNA processing enzyme)